MIAFRNYSSLVAAMALTACATTATRATGDALVGRSLRVEAEGTPPILLRFNADRTVIGTIGPQRAVGSWSVADAQICLEFPRQARDCWPYAKPFTLGKTMMLTSSAGSAAKVTLVE